MGGSHSVNIIMGINMTHIGRALIASRRLQWERVPKASKDHFVSLACECESLRSDFEASQQLADIRTAVTSKPALSLRDFEAFCHASRNSVVRVFIVVLYFSGERRERDIEHWLYDIHRELNPAMIIFVLSIEIARDPEWDLAHPRTAACLHALADGGYIDIVGGGPPCSTFSISRFNDSQPGPRPVRQP